MSSENDQTYPPLKIPTIAGGETSIPLQTESPLFIVGPNGSGKSALLQHIVFTHAIFKIRRVAAHRQTSINPNNRALTPHSRKDFEVQSQAREHTDEARWRDHDSQQRLAAVFYDLLMEEAAIDRAIASGVRENPCSGSALANENESLFDRLNSLLSLATLKIQLERSHDGEILARHEDAGEPYPIAEMSDGERNAAIIGATVITVEEGTILQIDEPERHLHRSIIEPFLTALFDKRPDCAFIISTHELALPMANPLARVLMLRSCERGSNNSWAWDVDLLEPNVGLPEVLRIAVLGSRRKILFTEGDATSPKSRDLPIYRVLFPDISVVPCGGSSQVRNAVDGLRGAQEFHHAEVFGLIDSDGREQDDDWVINLRRRGVFALDVYAVESLYYNTDSLDAVAGWQAKSQELDPGCLKDAALEAAFKALNKTGVAEDMAAKRIQLRIKDQLVSKAPTFEEIKDGVNPQFQIQVDKSFQTELENFNELLRSREFDQLVARYPLTDDVFAKIATSLKFQNRHDYERVLIVRIGKDEALALKLRNRIGPLSNVLCRQ